MQIKSILAIAAIALAASVGSAYAADQFATLDGVQAQPLIAAEMDQVRGANAVGGIALDIPATVANEVFIAGVVHLATVMHVCIGAPCGVPAN